jgi:hypothetical protein
MARTLEEHVFYSYREIVRNQKDYHFAHHAYTTAQQRRLKPTFSIKRANIELMHKV